MMKSLKKCLEKRMKNNIYLISAVDFDWGIGIDEKLPWSIKEEMDFFKNKTSRGKNAVVMGSTTAYSIPNMPLKDRENFIIDFSECPIAGTTTFSEDWTTKVKELSDKFDKVFVIGGKSIYKQALESGIIDVAIISKIPRICGCNVFFPKEGLDGYKITHTEGHVNFTTDYYTRGE